MKCLCLTLDVWKWEGCVLVGGTCDDFVLWAKKYIDADVGNGAGSVGRAYVRDNSPWLIWIDSLSNVATLAHEALHISAAILEARGLKLDSSSEEAYTYTMEFIIRSTLDAKSRDWKKA